jgi:DNA-binding response OmpR family regulator
VGRIAFLTDRSTLEALPALQLLGSDVKTEPLSPESLSGLRGLAPSVVVVDAAAAPDVALEVLRALEASADPTPVVVLLGEDQLRLHPWHEVADELVTHDDAPAFLELRLAMLGRRTGGAGDAVIRLGPLTIDVETYQVVVAGRVVDLTFKEFELLRFLVQRPGRVFTRSDLLKEVWGFDFYGGTRTVDVHVRRLRAKLGIEHEGLIQTVRGVGYRAAAIP